MSSYLIESFLIPLMWAAALYMILSGIFSLADEL